MSQSRHATLSNIINHVIEYAENQLPEEQVALFTPFIKMYYSNMSLEDIQARSVIDLYGTVLSHWELLQNRKPKETKIQVINPQYEQYGWQSTHTIIQVVSSDMPFMVDSMRMEINRMNLTTHLMIHSGGVKVKRDQKGNLVDVQPFYEGDPNKKGYRHEAPIHMEIDRQTDPKALAEIHRNLKRVLKDVQVAVEDWQRIQERVMSAIKDLNANAASTKGDVKEAVTFLQWLLNDHFTFLGFREYNLVGEGDDLALKLQPQSGLGVLRDHTHSKMLRQYADMPKSARELALSTDQPLSIAKTSTMSTVHRHGYTDDIRVKVFKKGKLTGELRFIGLYTSEAYRADPRKIPILRHKVNSILKRSDLPERSHSAKDLLHILSTLPRDDLFHGTTDELFELATGILHLQERRMTRLFLRKDMYGRFISCLIFVPRENFNTDLVSRIYHILQDDLHGLDISYSTYLSESVLARIHYVVRVDSHHALEIDEGFLEQKIIRASVSWRDGFRESVLDFFGEEHGNAIVARYRHAFPAGYREVFAPQQAIYDIEHIEKLKNSTTDLQMSFYRPLGVSKDVIRFKLFRMTETVPLSDALPMLENMGLRVIGEQPYQLAFEDGRQVWINDFGMTYVKEPTFEVEDVRAIFQQAFQKIWHGHAEDDSLNRLVLEIELNWREITVLRAYTKYFRQIGFTFSESYIANTLVNNARIAYLLVELFKTKFDPRKEQNRQEECESICEMINKALDEVAVLDEDRILRRYLNLINATLRTNYFQMAKASKPKGYLSFKLDPAKVPDLPQPLPKYEVFVYSPRFEGVHLRAAKVARGGLRWSDRPEDFRTEVLGLMKAQRVKNAVIVPGGAKGGFVPKCLPQGGSREAVMAEGVACYQTYIEGLLDLADNIVEGDIVPPKNTVCYDEPDAYVVVAADKGTATFSDIANAIAVKRGYWLGDAFASGGCTGYDHKKMGITARGAWVSAERHFQEMGIDVNTSEITVVGIGDLSGDVFGNGVLSSPHLKLVAAFNHQHIFLDPNPDAALSYEERKRMFYLPRSSWDDYDRSKISEGGGVFSRAAKAISLSKQVQELLGVKKEAMEPRQLIRAILKAKVDLLWNGGIGTYVKATSESNADVGDRSNDALRINGKELRAKVVCEGGNLGLTQLGRIEYELKGGRINTDFIDNSAGVDCSDHEVNIKILLNDIVLNSDMTKKQRDRLLAKMTESVAKLVLENNYYQNKALGVASSASARNLGIYMSFIDEEEKLGKINRELEFLPNDKVLAERRAANVGLTRPELSVLYSYSKIILKSELEKSEFIDSPALKKYLYRAFPPVLSKRFPKELESHYLAGEVIATQLCNAVVADMGITFAFQMQDETGASIPQVLAAYVAAMQIFNIEEYHREIEALDYQVDTAVQYQMSSSIVRLVRRAVRWLLRNRRDRLDIDSTVTEFHDHVRGLYKRMPKLLIGADKKLLEERVKNLVEKNVPEELAYKMASTTPLYHSLNIIEAANSHNVEVFRTAKIYFMLVDRMDLLWFRDQINAYPVMNRWSILAKAAYKGDLDFIQRQLTVGVLLGAKARSIPGKINAWFTKYETLIRRWEDILADLRNAEFKEFAILFVAIRELKDLAESSVGAVQ